VWYCGGTVGCGMVLLVSVGYYWVLLGTGWYWVILGCTGGLKGVLGELLQSTGEVLQSTWWYCRYKGVIEDIGGYSTVEYCQVLLDTTGCWGFCNG